MLAMLALAGGPAALAAAAGGEIVKKIRYPRIYREHAKPEDFPEGSTQREIVQAAADKRARRAAKSQMTTAKT